MNLIAKNALVVALLLSTTVTMPGFNPLDYVSSAFSSLFSGGVRLVASDTENTGDALVEAVQKAGGGDAGRSVASQMTDSVPTSVENINAALLYSQQQLGAIKDWAGANFEALQNYADEKLEVIKNIRLGDYLTYGFAKKAALAGLAGYGLKALWNNYRNGGKGSVVIHNRPQFNPVIHNNIDPQVLKSMMRDALLDAIDEA